MYASVPVSWRVGENTSAELFPLLPTDIPLPCHAAEGCEEVHPLSVSAPAESARHPMILVFS